MMYSAATVAVFASMLSQASAHYFFDALVINGQKHPEFVRSNTRPTAYMPTKWVNTFDNTTPDSTDFRCNVGATNKAAKDTAKVKAGDSLAMTLGVGATMKHPGPAQVYMSKAPSTAGAYDGSGYWFKIHQETVCRPSSDIKQDAWCTWDKDRVSFKIPSNIPDGDYLVRAEHIGLHGAHDGQAEFYYGCSQITVSGGTGSLPTTGLVKIPGVYKKSDAEVNFSVWGGNKNYPAQGPGPAIFGGSSSSSADASPDTGAETPATPASSAAPVASDKPSSAPINSAAPAVPSRTPSTPQTSNTPSQPQQPESPQQSGQPQQPKPTTTPINKPAPVIPSKGPSAPQASNIPSFPQQPGQPQFPGQGQGQQPGQAKPSCTSRPQRRHARDIQA